MEQYLPIAFIVVIAAFGYLTSEYIRLMRCVNDLRDLVDIVRQNLNHTTWVTSQLIPPEQENLKENLHMILMEDDLQ